MRPALAARAKARRSCSSPRTRPNAARLFGCAQRAAVREGRHQRRVVVHGERAGREPGAHRHQGGRALSTRCSAGASLGDDSSALDGHDAVPPHAQRPVGDDFDDVFAARTREADEFYATSFPRRSRRRGARDAPGARRPALVQAVLPLRRRATGSTAIPTQPPPPPERRDGPQSRVDAPLQRRRDLDAGQVGVPVVRGVGSRVPLRPARARRSGVRQGAARAAAARVVHASERAAARVRVGVRRREPAGARLGRAGASTRSRRSAAARATVAFLERVFHKLLLNFTWWVNRKDAEGNNVFQGGFLGLDNIGVFDRSDAAADRRRTRAVRRHELDGDVLPEHARDRARARARRTRRTRTSPASSSSTSSTSPTR